MISSIHAACVLVFNCTDDEVLSVSRKNQVDDKGLPGGKIEAGELPLQAALRELKEETGIELDPNEVADDCFIGNGNSGKEVLTVISTICKKAEFRPSEEGVVEWIAPQRLTQGSFGKYNEALLNEFNRSDAPKATCGCKEQK